MLEFPKRIHAGTDCGSGVQVFQADSHSMGEGSASKARTGYNVLVCIISDNVHTHSLGREVVSEILGDTSNVACVSPPLLRFDADLYLWDLVPKPGTFASVKPEDNWRHFFLVDGSDVELLRCALPMINVNILLKPVGKAALKAFLTNVCEQMASAQNHSIEALRADRDDILQCFMQANLKLQEYDHDRTRFLARAIHDFRAPLTAITGYCGLLLGEDVGTLAEEQREVIERMHRSAKKLSRMASAMFQLSIAPRAEANVDVQPGDIGECIDQAIHEILPAAQDKRLSVCSNALPAPEPLHFDRMKIEQVLVNLLENACKFAPRGGMIEIKGYPYYWDDRSVNPGLAGEQTLTDWEHPNGYRLDIRDTGPGIPPMHLGKIFEEYTSYGGGVDRSGGGLGLAICRMILKQHKGRIWAESSHNGAVFSFVLPFHRAVVPQEQLFRTADARTF